MVGPSTGVPDAPPARPPVSETTVVPSAAVVRLPSVVVKATAAYSKTLSPTSRLKEPVKSLQLLTLILACTAAVVPVLTVPLVTAARTQFSVAAPSEKVIRSPATRPLMSVAE